MKTNAEKPKFVQGDLTLQRSGTMNMSELSDLARRHPESFMSRTQDLIDTGKLTLRSIPDLKAYWQAFRDVPVKAMVDIGGGQRSPVATSSFPLLTGSLVVAEINRAYDSVPTIGQELVQEFDSNKKISHVAKIHNLVHGELKVKEGDPFPLISASETFSTIGSNRKGFQLALTQEVIEENDIASFINLVDQGGIFAAELIEEQTLSRVCDQNGSASSPAEPYAYHLNNAAQQLYTASTTTFVQAPKGTRVINNAMADINSLNQVRITMAAMLNTRGKRLAIPMSETILLVPDALVSLATTLRGSDMTPGVFNELNPWGPRGLYQPKLVSSPKLDDISSTAWYMGAFKRQFRRKRKIALETVSIYSGPTDMAFLEKREAFRSRVAWDIEVGAIDHVFVVQSLSGTEAVTAPAAATTNL